MKKAAFIITALALILIAAPQRPKASPIDGEIGIKGTTFNKTPTGLINRFREYAAVPRDASVSLLNLDYPFLQKAGLFTFRGTDIGENDVDASWGLTYKKLFNYDASYAKTPHLIDLAAGNRTDRLAQNFKLDILPLRRVSASLTFAKDDKVGSLPGANTLAPPFIVDEQDKTSGAQVNAGIGSFVLTGGAAKNEFTAPLRSHDMDAQNVSINMRPGQKLWANASYDTNKYTAGLTNTATNTVKLKNTGVAAQLLLSNRVTLSASWADKKRDNDGTADPAITRARSRSYDDKALSAGVNYRTHYGKVGVSYLSNDRGFSGQGAEISSRKTETLKVKASTQVSFLGIKFNYDHGYRDISGLTQLPPARVWNYLDMSGEFSNRLTSVNLLGFKRFSLIASSSYSGRRFNPSAAYGVSSIDSKNNGVTAGYAAMGGSYFTLSANKNQNRISSRQLFTLSSAVPPAVDLNSSVTYGNSYISLGGEFPLKESTTLNVDYTISRTNVSDPSDSLLATPAFAGSSNKVHERTLSLNLRRKLTQSYTANIGLAFNRYSNLLDTAFAPKSNVFSIELKKKF